MSHQEQQEDEFSFKKLFVPLTTFKAIHIIVIVGFVIFANGLFNQFVLDDTAQIGVGIHPLSNIITFFSSSTFYNGEGILTGIYYKPLLSTSLALLFSFFGNNPFMFHLFQIVLHILNASLIFLVFKHFFTKSMSLLIALIFLIHPINSEAVFYISNIQEVLFLFFGLLALWVLIHTKSKKKLSWVILCLFFSILSKETGILFFITVIVYTFFFCKKYLKLMLIYEILAFIAYLVLRINAVGIFSKPMNAPISELSLIERFFNIPEIFFFYIKTFLIPISLSSSHQWVITKITFINFFFPLILDLVCIGAIAYFAFMLYKKYELKDFKLYIFFSVWFILGIVLHLQIIPLDETVAARWFYFPIIGVLGMLAVLLEVFHFRLKNKWVFTITGIVLVSFSMITFMRSFDWRNDFILATHDIKTSQNSYALENRLSFELMKQGKFKEAKFHAEKSVAMYPYFTNYNNLGSIYLNLKEYKKAKKAYLKALEFGDYYAVYENLALVGLVDGNPKENIKFMEDSLKKFPQNAKIWLYLAIAHNKMNNINESKKAITQAYKYSKRQDIVAVYNQIMNDKPLNINIKFTVDH